jgi:NADPH:quinone reductase
MKVVQSHEYGPPDVLKYESVDDIKPDPTEILIKVESASVNYSDVMRRSNIVYPFPTPLPFIPGSEVAGVIVELGEEVEGLHLGTPVFALVGSGSNGYAQYAVVPANQAIPIPPGIDVDQAAALPVAGTAALMILRETAKLQPGETVLIQGAAGGVGSFAIQIAKILGASTIIGAISSTSKKQKVLELGADYTVDYSQPDWPNEIHKLTEGKGVDVILEMSGGKLFSQGLRCLAPFGRIVVYGMASGEPLIFDNESILHFFYKPSLNQSIHVYNLGTWFGMQPEIAAKAMEDLIGYVASQQIKVTVDHVLPLAKASEAHRMLEQRETTGKIILKPWQF